MKIAFIVSSFPKLSETFIINQITGLLDKGHEVEIFTPTIAEDGPIHSDIAKYKIMDRIHCLQAVPKTRIVRQLKAVSMIAAALPFHPKRVSKAVAVFLSKYRERSLLGFFSWILPFIKKDFDIIHCHFGPNGIRSICLKEIGLTTKIITTLYGYDIATYIEENGKDVYSELFEKCDLFTYISETGKKRILDLGCSEDKMVKLPMGIYLDKFPFSEQKPGPKGEISVLSVGRLVEMKGREYAIKAMAQIIKKHPNINYNIVGDGILRQPLQQLIDDLGVEASIHLLGWVTTEKLDQLYHDSHILLHPSVVASNGNTEGQGVVLVEAQAMGMPVVATNHGAFPETVLDGKSGFLTAERDVEDLAEKLEYLVMNTETWPEIGRCGRSYVEEKFDIKVLNRRLETIYQNLLDSR